MEKYVIYECVEASGIERGVSTLAQWQEKSFLQKSTSGLPMKVVKEFEAETWEYAMQVYYDHYGYGKYVPME
jgi:hypothetical protein